MTLRNLIHIIRDFEYLAFFARLFNRLFLLAVEYWKEILLVLVACIVLGAVFNRFETRDRRKRLKRREEEHTGRFYKGRRDREL